MHKYLTSRKLAIAAAIIVAGIAIVVLNPGRVLSPITNYGNPPEEPQDNFNKAKHSLDDPDSIWVIVSKVHPVIPNNFTPKELTTPNVLLRGGGDEMTMRKGAAKALEQMFSAAKKDGIDLMLASGYRSYDLQESVYNRELLAYGLAKTDAQVARPGHSEHQTGLVADIADAAGTCVVDDCFANTAEYKWLNGNAFLFGFIQRYTEGKQQVTGYRTESWHFRYVGPELSREMKAQKIETLEEFFNIVPEKQPW